MAAKASFSLSLVDKSVVVTGAAGGIGVALSRYAASRGARVAMLDYNEKAAADAAQGIRESGGKALALGCDVTDFAQCASAIARASAEHGGIDILINNAGVTHLSAFEDTTVDAIRRVMEVNFFGAVHCTKAALPALIQARGHIAVLSSVAGIAPLVNRTGYAASKHALHGFFDSLRAELVEQDVRVTIICPSFVETNIRSNAVFSSDKVAVPKPTTKTVLMPEDIANAIFAGIEAGTRQILPSFVSRFAWYAARIAPKFYERKMREAISRD